MIFFYLQQIYGLAGECTPVPDGLVINKYYLADCGACKRLAPVMDEIKSKIERADVGVTIREVECTECECEGITSFPTLEITQDKEVKSKTIGYKNYDDLSKWISENLKLDIGIFINHIEHEQGVVKELVSRDFLSGFDGQWLILFYENKSDIYRSHFKEIAKLYKDKVNFGEAQAEEAQSVTNRFNITEYPHVIGINNGISLPYSGEPNLNGLTKFTERLYKPNFESIDYIALKSKGKSIKSGEPIFVVLYKNFELASHYFNDLAQQFKFKANIYKSNDPAMFEASGYHPKELSDFEAAPDHNKMIYFLVYKNGIFYPSPSNLQKAEEIVQWIFHSHFAHVTNINNENFYSVFHGIKPVILLLTESEQLVEEFNRVSADRHLGTPFTDLIFATLDVAEYPLFKNQILKQTKVPAIAFYDPINVKWYYREANLTEKNIHITSLQMIEQYFNKKLPAYPPKKSRIGVYLIIAVVIGVFGFAFRATRNRKKLD